MAGYKPLPFIPGKTKTPSFSSAPYRKKNKARTVPVGGRRRGALLGRMKPSGPPGGFGYHTSTGS
jgi:hypothetical protein